MIERDEEVFDRRASRNHRRLGGTELELTIGWQSGALEHHLPGRAFDPDEALWPEERLSGVLGHGRPLLGQRALALVNQRFKGGPNLGPAATADRTTQVQPGGVLPLQRP